MVVKAQTMNVVVGSVTYQFPAVQTGDMTYSDGTSLTILGKTFAISDIEKIYVDETAVTDNLVTVTYASSSATVTVAGNVAQYVTPTISGAHVSIEQTNTAAVDDDEITYSLTGTTSDGGFELSGAYKCTIALNGVTLTNPDGAAINITNKKRIQISAKKGTTNTLTDSSNGSQKGCIYSKGQIQLQGNGTLNVYGNTAHAIKSGDYISVKNLTLNIPSAVSDGINCNGYFLMQSGNVSISGIGDDGIQCDLDGDTSTGETEDHEDEDSGNIYILGGTLNITATGTDTKCIKSEGSTAVSGGTIDLKASGAGGKCIKADGELNVSGGTITAQSTGSQYRVGSDTTQPKAIKSEGAMTISGGEIIASSTNHEAIESKSTITITDGYVYAYAGDDAINASGDFTITGGYVMGNSTGNDGLDANGNFYIKGGTVFAVATRSPEVAIDANTEQSKKLYITGGTVVAIGGLEGGSSLSGVTAKQASSYSKGSTYALYNGGTLALAFKVPSNNSMGTPMVVVTSGTPTLSSGATGSGTTFWNGYGYSSASGGSSVSLSDYTASNGGGGGTPGGGGNPGGGGPGGGGPGGGR